jgi:hypothetical protein
VRTKSLQLHTAHEFNGTYIHAIIPFQGLSMLAWAYAQLDVEHPALLQRLVRAAKAKARWWVLFVRFQIL